MQKITLSNHIVGLETNFIFICLRDKIELNLQNLRTHTPIDFRDNIMKSGFSITFLKFVI